MPDTGPDTPGEPELFYFKDDGKIPNSKYPVILYRNAFPEIGDNGAVWLEKRFAKHNWTNSWRNGILGYHHYHSNSHEVLGIYEGEALLQLGGEFGSRLHVKSGDIIIIPAGVGHKKLESAEQFKVVGAYPNGKDYDLLKGDPGERPAADISIAAIPKPEFDPFLGKTGGLPTLWQEN